MADVTGGGNGRRGVVFHQVDHAFVAVFLILAGFFTARAHYYHHRVSDGVDHRRDE